MKLGQGNILHVSVILLTGGVVVWSREGVVSNFWGGVWSQGRSPIFLGGGGIWSRGVSLIFWGVSPILGGLQFFGGVSNFSGGLQFFFSHFFHIFFPKISSGMHHPPPRQSMRSQYTSYWNAFLFCTNFQANSKPVLQKSNKPESLLQSPP